MFFPFKKIITVILLTGVFSIPLVSLAVVGPGIGSGGGGIGAGGSAGAGAGVEGFLQFGSGGSFLSGLLDLGSCLLSPVLNLFSSTIGPQTAYATVSVAESAALKEGCPDIEAWFLSKILLRFLIGDVINWIQTGDINGGPLFITNFRDFFYKTQEDAKTIFIESLLSPSVQNTIPSPFRDIVTESAIIALRTPSVHIPSTLIGIVADDNMLYEDYSQSGLIGLFHILTMPQNNSFGRTMLALDDAEHEIAQRIAEANVETLSYSGFKGYADCVGGVLTNIVQDDTCIKRLIKTPGINAADIVSRIFGSDINLLEGADEISEIVTVFLNRLLFSGLLEFDTSGGSLNPVPHVPPGATTTPPGRITPPGGLPPGSPPGSIVATNSCSSGASANTISFIPRIPLQNELGIYAVRYCTGAGCLPTTSDPIACSAGFQNTTCTHQNLVPGVTYGYRAFEIANILNSNDPGFAVTDAAFAEALSCTQPSPSPGESPGKIAGGNICFNGKPAVTLTWVPDTTVSPDTPVTVHYTIGFSSFPTLNDPIACSSTAGGKTSCAFANVTVGTKYTFKLFETGVTFPPSNELLEVITVAQSCTL